MKILIIRSGAIGDFVVTLPLIQGLRERFHEGRISLVCHSRVWGLAKYIVDEFIDFDGEFLLGLFADKIDFDCESARRIGSFDLIISFLNNNSIAAQNLRKVCGDRVVQIDPTPPEDYDGHITDYLLEPVKHLLIAIRIDHPRIILKEDELRFADDFFRGMGISDRDRIVTVHPGSGSKRKNMSAERFGILCNEIKENNKNAEIFIVEGEGDRDEVREVRKRLNFEPIILKNLNLIELAAVLSKARVFIGNDSGIAHISAAVGVPTIAIFQSTNPRIWSPRGNKVWIERDDEGVVRHILDIVSQQL